MHDMRLGCIDILWTKRKTIHRNNPLKDEKTEQTRKHLKIKGYSHFRFKNIHSLVILFSVLALWHCFQV